MNEEYLGSLYLKDTAFDRLMQQRIYHVLLVASTYDSFMLEEDGRVEEQIFMEYVSLNLSSPPRVTRVSTYDEAMDALQKTQFNLLIAMPGVDLGETFERAHDIKAAYPDMPFVVLTPFSREVSRRLEKQDLSSVDYVFSWLGNVDLLVAIIKLMEDRMNAPVDVVEVGVRMIMLVEDSVRFYSSLLPVLYKFILRQSQRFSTEALNAHETMLRMRGRPKVVLARTYEEAMRLYEIYGDKMLGVISDVSFQRKGAKDPKAGLALAYELRSRDPYLPLIIESSDAENAQFMSRFGGTFLDKNSKKLPHDLGRAIMDHFGFGDFIIRNPNTGAEIMRIRNLKGLQDHIFDIPADSLRYHAQQNDISRWLYSRALFPIANVVQQHRFAGIDEAPAVRRLFFDLIVKYRRMKNRGVVAEFKRERFDRYSNFARIGQGSLGGKARGLAFIDSEIKRRTDLDAIDGVEISIPPTVVLCTDVFDEFMETNDLYPLALSDVPDETILKAFTSAELPDSFRDDFAAIYDVIDGPFAVRSSSLLEDSHYQPFAGVYATYMVPHLADKERTLKLLSSAVKAVYASVFYAESKAYMTATRNVIDQEKMAIIIQGVVGEQRGRYFYPSFSGVGRSINYYPVGKETPEEGICEVAVGMGKYIVDGSMALRFSPSHPRHVLQTSSPAMAMRDTQKYFYAIDTEHAVTEFSLDEGFNMEKRSIQEAAAAGELRYLVSTYDLRNDRIIDSDEGEGVKLATFANILQHDVFPLAKIVRGMLEMGEQAMGRPVEIEFAGLLASPQEMSQGKKGKLYWLQIRPMVDRREEVDRKLLAAPREHTWLRSSRALGNGNIDDVHAIVLVKKNAFTLINNCQIACEIDKINRNFTDAEEGYILAGPGRWGSSDHALGIPVKWASIAGARLVVELTLPERHIEPSQGTHFFQNLTSFGVGYFTIGDDDFFDSEWLASQTPCQETEFLAVYRFEQPLRVAIDGMTGTGVALKPLDFNEEN